MKHRITMLTTGFPRFDGDLFGFFVSELAQAQARRGDQVLVLAPGAEGVADREEGRGFKIRRIRYALPAGLQKLAYGGGLVPNLRAKPYLAALLPQFLLCLGLVAGRAARSGDIFHAQWVVPGWLGLLFRWLHNKPVVVTLRGTDQAIISKLPKRLARLAMNGFDAITTVSQEIRDRVLGLGIEPERVFLTPNGVNTELFCTAEQEICRAGVGLECDGPVLMWAGRLAPEKGVADLIKAMPYILERVPETILVLLGDGPLRAELESLATELGVSEAVLFKGGVARHKLRDWYNAADLVCLPSLREGRPNTVLEGLACGRPILATAVGGVPELIEDGRNGRLVPAREPETMGRVAAEMLSGEDELARMCRMGPESLEEMGLTWEASAEKLAGVYEAALAYRAELNENPRLIGRPWSPWLIFGWAGLVLSIFISRYWEIMDSGYGITEKLSREGFWSVLGRWLGL